MLFMFQKKKKSTFLNTWKSLIQQKKNCLDAEKISGKRKEDEILKTHLVYAVSFSNK